MQNGIAECKKTGNSRDRQMFYKCRLLYARGLSRREANRETNGVVDQLSKKLRQFLAACEGSLESKVRGCILQYFNPMVALSAQVYIKPVNKQVEETVCFAKGNVKQVPVNLTNDELDLQLALLRSQMTGMQHQVPFIAHRLQTLCRSLALTESALRGQQQDLALRKNIVNKSQSSLAEIVPGFQTSISHGLTIPGASSPLRLQPHIMFNGGPSSHSPSSSPKRKADFAARASKLINGHNIAIKKLPKTMQMVPIFPNGMLNTSVPKIIGLPPRTLASISNRSNIVTSGAHPIWNQGVPSLFKLAPRAPGTTTTFHSPHQLLGTSFASPSSPTKTSPRVRPTQSNSLHIAAKLAAAAVLPKSSDGLHSETVPKTEPITVSTSTGPEKRARSDEGLQGNSQVRRPRVEPSNGYGQSVPRYSRSSVLSK